MGNRAMKIEDICKVSSSKRIFAREYVETGVPFWRGKEVTEHATGKNDSKGLFISVRRYNELKQTGNVPSDDDVLITAVGTIGSIYQIKHEDLPFYFKDGNIIRLSNWNTERVNPTYVSLFLRSQIGQQAIKEVEIGSTQKALTIKDIAKVPILLPELKTQNDIAAAIGFIDAKIKINHQINKNLQKLKDDIWISQRVDKKTSLSNLMTIQSGKRPIDRYDNKFRLKELYPIIGANGVMGWTSKALTAGTIITTGRVGTHGVVNMFDEPVWVSDNSFVISSKYEEVAYEILRCDVKFLTLVHGTTQPLITQKDLKQYVVSIPSNNQLKKVNEHLKVYTNLINVNNKQNKFLTALRNLLLPKLLSGEIDLSDVKEVIQGD